METIKQFIIDPQRLEPHPEKFIDSNTSSNCTIYTAKLDQYLPVSVQKFKTNKSKIPDSLLKDILDFSTALNPLVTSFYGICYCNHFVCLVYESILPNTVSAVTTLVMDLPWFDRLLFSLQLATTIYFYIRHQPPLFPDNFTDENIFLDLASKKAIFHNFLIIHFQAAFDCRPEKVFFLAPELIDNKEKLSNEILSSSTLYSLSLIFYIIATAQKPYEMIIDIPTTISKIKHEKLRPKLKYFPLSTPPEFKKLITLCWEEDPLHRPSWVSILKQLELLVDQFQNFPNFGPLTVFNPNIPIDLQYPFSVYPNDLSSYTNEVRLDFYDGYYIGEVKDDKANGKGTRHYEKGETKGDRYEGEWKDDLFHGKGTYYYNNGDIYSGSYENGFKEGYGEFKWVTGPFADHWFEGMFVKDRKNGDGIFYYPSGKRFEGKYKNDQKTSGTFFLTDGTTEPFDDSFCILI